MRETTGEKLRKLRAQRGETLRTVAARIGITCQAMQNYETDKRVPRDDIKKKIAEYYGTTVGLLFFAEKTNKTKG